MSILWIQLGHYIGQVHCCRVLQHKIFVPFRPDRHAPFNFKNYWWQNQGVRKSNLHKSSKPLQKKLQLLVSRSIHGTVVQVVGKPLANLTLVVYFLLKGYHDVKIKGPEGTPFHVLPENCKQRLVRTSLCFARNQRNTGDTYRRVTVWYPRALRKIAL